MKNKIVIIGQAPAKGGDGRPAFDGWPKRYFAWLSGASPAGIELFLEFTNLLNAWPGKKGKGDNFPMTEATESANRMTYALQNRRVIFCGRNVAKAFGHFDDRYFEWDTDDRFFTYAVMPHVSRINRWWNEPKNVERATAFFHELYMKEVLT